MRLEDVRNEERGELDLQTKKELGRSGVLQLHRLPKRRSLSLAEATQPETQEEKSSPWGGGHDPARRRRDLEMRNN